MRSTVFALAAGVLIAGTGGAEAMTMTDDEAMATPCRTYLASFRTPIYGALIDAVSARLSAAPNSDRFGSTCNMGNYVKAECKMHPKYSLRRAIKQLEQDGAEGRLPQIPMCGA